MVGRKVKSVASGFMMVFLLCLVVGCASSPPRPGFVGIPEAVERTPDFALPLKDEDREVIVDFMLNEGRRPLPWWSRGDVDPGLIQDIQDEYGGLLHALSERAPFMEDLSAGGKSRSTLMPPSVSCRFTTPGLVKTMMGYTTILIPQVRARW
jgi:hypothetical protein